MKACVYQGYGGPEVLQVVDRPEPTAGAGEVVVRVVMSGVNPTDTKSRQGLTAPHPFPYREVVPGQDGSGVIASVGPDVDPSRVGERVWIWESQWQRPSGTAQELVALPSDHAVKLDDAASFELGAGVGIPAMTAHRCLTVGLPMEPRLGPGALTGRHVLVAGGAGAVGHAAIELARWSGATVITTVSSFEKAELATAAGAHVVINYRTHDVVHEVREVAPNGVDVIVEVDAVDNWKIDSAVLSTDGSIAIYTSGPSDLVIAPRPAMAANAHLHFVLVYTVPMAAKRAAVRDMVSAISDRALRAGEESGLPLHHFPLEQIGEAHRALEGGATGKVLVDVSPS